MFKLYKISLLVIFYLLKTCNSFPSLNITYDQRQTGKYNIHLSIKDVAIIAFDDKTLESSISSDDNSYDYDYDYDQLTINPLVGLYGTPTSSTNKPTPKPTTTETQIINVTIKPSVPVINKPSNIQDVIIASNHQAEKHNITEAAQSTKIPNVIIINKIPENPIINITTEKNNFSYQNMQQIPVQIIMEPVLKPKVKSNFKSRNNLNIYSRKPSVEIINNNSNNSDKKTFDLIEPMKHCAEGQFLDKLGRCRSRRSGIRHLLNLLFPKQLNIEY